MFGNDHKNTDANDDVKPMGAQHPSGGLLGIDDDGSDNSGDSSSQSGPSTAPPAPNPSTSSFSPASFDEPKPNNQEPESDTPELSKPLSSKPMSSSASDDELLDIKKEALQELSPLIDHLEQSSEEKFRTTMMMIQASDNKALIPQAFRAAKEISDDKKRAQALLDIVNEINYFTHKNPA